MGSIKLFSEKHDIKLQSKPEKKNQEKKNNSKRKEINLNLYPNARYNIAFCGLFNNSPAQEIKERLEEIEKIIDDHEYGLEMIKTKIDGKAITVPRIYSAVANAKTEDEQDKLWDLLENDTSLANCTADDTAHILLSSDTPLKRAKRNFTIPENEVGLWKRFTKKQPNEINLAAYLPIIRTKDGLKEANKFMNRYPDIAKKQNHIDYFDLPAIFDFEFSDTESFNKATHATYEEVLKRMFENAGLEYNEESLEPEVLSEEIKENTEDKKPLNSSAKEINQESVIISKHSTILDKIKATIKNIHKDEIAKIESNPQYANELISYQEFYSQVPQMVSRIYYATATATKEEEKRLWEIFIKNPELAEGNPTDPQTPLQRALRTFSIPEAEVERWKKFEDSYDSDSPLSRLDVTFLLERTRTSKGLLEAFEFINKHPEISREHFDLDIEEIFYLYDLDNYNAPCVDVKRLQDDMTYSEYLRLKCVKAIMEASLDESKEQRSLTP